MKTKNNNLSKNFEHKREGRTLTFQALYAYDINPKDPEALLSFDANKSSSSASEYAKILLNGVLEHLFFIDQLIKERLKRWDFERISLVDKAVLRMAIYEMMFEDLPDLVVINEAVEIIKEFGNEDSYKFVNGILDAISKGKQKNIQEKEQSPN